MGKTYQQCADLYSRKLKKNNFKRISHNQVLRYNADEDCYEHVHHQTTTVKVYRGDCYRIYTGGWDTQTTWRKIHEFVPLCVGRAPKNIIGGKFVFWDGWTKFTEFYDGILVDRHGKPFAPKPVEMRVLKLDATKPFNEMVRKVRLVLLPRILNGEFDEVGFERTDSNYQRDRRMLDIITSIAESYDGLLNSGVPVEKHRELLDQIIDVEDVELLFVPRSQQCFGRDRYYWRDADKPAPRTARQRLETNIKASRERWLSQQITDEVYDTVERSFT